MTLLGEEEVGWKQTKQGKDSSLVLLEGSNFESGGVDSSRSPQTHATILVMCKFRKSVVSEMVMGLYREKPS